MRYQPLARRFVIGVSVVVAGALLAGCGDEEQQVQVLRGAVRNPPLEVGEVSLPDVGHGGVPVPMQAPSGELYLVYFGYASCPDVCPTTLSEIRIALESLPEPLRTRITVVMATVDAERDSDEVLTGYLDHFFDRNIALRTTDGDELQAAATAFGVQWQVEDHAPGETYDVAHTAVTYVVDDTGTVVVEWPFGFESDAMAADLTTLLGREEPA